MSRLAYSIANCAPVRHTWTVACVALVISHITPTITLVQPETSVIESVAVPVRETSTLIVAARLCLPGSACVEGSLTVLGER